MEPDNCSVTSEIKYPVHNGFKELEQLIEATGYLTLLHFPYYYACDNCLNI